MFEIRSVEVGYSALDIVLCACVQQECNAKVLIPISGA